MRQNPWHVPRPRSSRLRTVTLLACAALVVAVALITSALIRDPSPSEVRIIELRATPPSVTASPTPAKRRERRPARREPTHTPTPTPTPTASPSQPGGFAPPPDDDGSDDDPFDDDADDDDADEG
jgi:hypothetical protein